MAALELKMVRPLLSRRELIATFLGSAVATAACKRLESVAPVPGKIVDHAFELGHQLRKGTLPVSSEPARRVEVAIVGGGAAGLSAAWRLKAAGVSDFVVLELEEALGGTSQSGKNHVSAFPWGAHYLPAPVEAGGPVGRLLEELGAVTGVFEDGRPKYAEELLIREPEERLFYKGHWYEGLYLRAGASPQDLAELARFEAKIAALSRARDARGRRAFAVPVARSSDDAEWTQLDRISFADWLAREGFTSPRLKWFVEYGCRDDFGMSAATTSAWAGLWYFCARSDGEGHRSAGYLSWPEGNGRLIAHLAGSVGAARAHRETLVHTVTPSNDGEGGCRIDALEHGRPVTWLAKQVVIAAPRFIAARLIPAWRQSPPAFLSGFQYGPWVVANLTLKAPPDSRGYPLSWDNVFYESPSLGYVVATHQRPLAWEGGPTVLTWYLPLTGDPKAEREKVLGAKYDAWERLVMADMLPAHPGIGALAESLEVMRWGHAMVQPRPGFIWGKGRQEAAASLGADVHFAHSDLGGMALFEEACHSGVGAAERVLEGLGREAPTWM